MSDPKTPVGPDAGAPLLGETLTNGRFLTGALAGGAVTLLLTNPAVQRAAISMAAHVWMALKGGVEETRERFRDAESEIKAARTK